MGFPRKLGFPGWMFSISLSQREDQPADPRPQLIKETGPPCCYLFCSQFITDTIWRTNFGLGDFLLTNIFFSFSQRNYLDTMLSCYLFLIISLMISFRDVRGSASGSNCTENPVFTPSALVVKYGDPANVTCVVCQKDCRGDVFGLEHAVGKVTQNGTTMFWTVDRLTEWDTLVMCYYNHVASDQCSSTLDLTLYQPPESVSISFVNHTGMMFEEQQYTLQCSVQNVAPVQNLTVTFYRGNTALGHQQSNSEEKKPVNETFTLNTNSSREYNGAQYWCEAKLELGPAGSQRPPVVTSEKLPAIVHYGPELIGPPNPDDITVTEGDALHLNCSFVGNPRPSYTWTVPVNSSLSDNGGILTIKSVGFEHEGQYICTVSNTVGTVTKEFNIDVQASPLIWIIVGVSAAVLFVFILCVLCFRSYKQNRKGSYNLKDVLRFPKHTALPLQNCENV